MGEGEYLRNDGDGDDGSDIDDEILDPASVPPKVPVEKCFLSMLEDGSNSNLR